MNIDKIHDLVSSAKVDRALKGLAQLPVVKADEDYKTTVTMLTAQYKSNERGKMGGFVSHDNYNVKRNQITHSLLTLLKDLKEDGDILSPVNDLPVANPDPIVTGTVQPTIVNDGPEPSPSDITKILFLASNPSDTAKLQLRKEHSEISERLQEATEPHKYPIKPYRAVTPTEFSEFIFEERPSIVHFSGHGDRSNPDVEKAVYSIGRPKPKDPAEIAEESGIFLMDEDKRGSHFVNTTFLKRTFKSMVQRHGIPIQAVVFNACHSSVQAEAISKVVPYVIGTSWSVGDEAAIAFASGFYFGITKQMSIEDAVDFGINAALAFNEPEDRFLLYKDGVKVEW